MFDVHMHMLVWKRSMRTLVNMCCTVFYISRVVVGGSPFHFRCFNMGPPKSHPNKHNTHNSLPLGRLMRVACETKVQTKLNSHKLDLHFEDKNNLSSFLFSPQIFVTGTIKRKRECERLFRFMSFLKLASRRCVAY